MDGIVEITTTVEQADQAEAIGRHLVESRLAACVHVTGPIRSIYRWKGEVCEAQEFRCTVKSSKRLQAEVMEAIQQIHPYDVPEVLCVDVAGCSIAYSEWLRSQLAD